MTGVVCCSVLASMDTLKVITKFDTPLTGWLADRQAVD